MSLNPFYRAPIITIEGADRSTNTILAENLSHNIKNPSNTSPRYNEDMSAIGFLVSESRKGFGEITDLVQYNLRVANMWEFQPELRQLANTGVTPIFNNYVFSNRANLLKKGTVSIELCPQLDAGLLKPDLQIYVKSDPETLKGIPTFFPWDTAQTRLEQSQAFNKLAETYPNLHVIDNSPEDILNAAHKVLEIYNQLKLEQLPKITIFNGID